MEVIFPQLRETENYFLYTCVKLHLMYAATPYNKSDEFFRARSKIINYNLLEPKKIRRNVKHETRKKRLVMGTIDKSILIIDSFRENFAILGTAMSVNIATRESDHGCYHYMLMYGLKPHLWKYLLNMSEFN